MLYCGALAGALHELDRAHYSVAKRELIRKWRDDLFPQLPTYTDSDLPRRYFSAKNEESKKRAENELRNLLTELVSQDNCIFRAQVFRADRTRSDDALLIEIPSPRDQERKLKRYNTFQTSLFSRDFEDTLNTYIREPGIGGALPVGMMAISWTTPDWEPIRQLTQRYRVIAVLLAIGISAIFAFFLRFSILPLRRVSGAIEMTLQHQPVLLDRPTAQLEKAYNDLARDALANRLQTDLNAFIQQNVNIDIGELYDRFVYLLATLLRLPYVSVQIANLSDQPRPIRIHQFPVSAPEGNLATDNGQIIPGIQSVYRDFYEDEINGEQHTLTLGFASGFYRSNPDWCEETADRLADSARRAVESLKLHQASIFRQRSEASINLAENLGHDLTNIIATAKLDLSTLQQILQMDEEEFLQTAQAREVLSESVEHLLANARFLQEIVNIYRAYTYLRKPKYEMICLNTLLDNLATLFLSSISSQVRLEKHLAPELPPCEVEPRLLKLAFFNLLTNAVEAVKQAQAAGEEREPVISVETKWIEERREAVLIVRDSGLGIRNDRGELALPEEIESIFRLGFTTKSESVGSGLGLSWVRSIITEFHSGRIEAANVPKGGAEFRLRLPQGVLQQTTIL